MVKDKILTWFLRNVYLPRIEIIDKVGFILVSDSKTSFLRDISFPEYIFMELEKKLNGKVMYDVGKTFGYYYARNIDNPVIDKSSRKTFLNGIYFTVRYIESISYGHNLKYSIDYNKKTFEMTAEDFIICSKNGLGHTIMEGTIAGYCAYAFSDTSIEGVQISCQGRGDEKCELICAPSKILTEKRLNFFRSDISENLKIDKDYLDINRIHDARFSEYSLKKLIDMGLFRYDHGTINYNDERFFLCEASIMYILEKKLKKIKKANKILFDISFDWGEKIAKKESDNSEKSILSDKDSAHFISNFMAALGWGDILVSVKSEKYTISSNYFPWTRLAKSIDFVMFRGIISGLLSGFFKRKIILTKSKTDLLDGYFRLTLSET